MLIRAESMEAAVKIYETVKAAESSTAETAGTGEGGEEDGRSDGEDCGT